MPPAIAVHLPGPLDLAATLEPYRHSGDDLLDRWDRSRLLRTRRLRDGIAAWRATPAGTTADPRLDVATDRHLRGEEEALRIAIRATIVPVPASWPALLARDPVLAALDARHPGLRPVLQPDLLTALVRSISAQQVNLRWAATMRRRLAEAFGERYQVDGEAVFRLRADRLAEASVEQVRALQFTTARALAIQGVATAIADGSLDGDMLAREPDAAVTDRLIGLRGIGRWTAEWILARTFGRPVVMAGDLGVRKAVGQAYLGVAIASEAGVRRATEHWGEGAAVAQALLLQTLVR